MKLILALYLSLLSYHALAETEPSDAQLYKWVDRHGNTHFSDQQPSHTKAEAIETSNTLSITAPTHVPAATNAPRKNESKKPKEDYHCKKYLREINKISIYLQHTPNELDERKLKDLKQQHKLECRGKYAKRDHGNSSCRKLHRRLNKLNIYNQHTPNDRDQQQILDLQKQIKLEC